jgi:hypothetical protein
MSALLQDAQIAVLNAQNLALGTGGRSTVSFETQFTTVLHFFLPTAPCQKK